MAGVLQIMPDGLIPVEIEGIRQVRLVELLGVGGFSSVWKVVDTATNKPYTLKVIQKLAAGKVPAERVRREAAVSIPSEYIVSVIGLREWDKSTFLILFEYFNGISLDKLIDAGTLSEEQKQRIYVQVLKGVADAHRNNIIHRDLKPGNVLVGDGDVVKLIDFGISKFKGVPLTESGDIMGTFMYMAPEILIQGAKVADARCDIYSLGHIFYELAMGEHFWIRQGWSQLDDLLSFLNRVPAPIEAIDLSDFTCTFFMNAHATLARMVKLEADERYRTVNEVLVGLGVEVPDPSKTPTDLHLRSPLLIVESGTNLHARTVLGLEDGEKRVLDRYDIAGGDSSISRPHLEFSRRGNRYFVRDLGSKNGTLLRGVLLKAGDAPQEIRHTDRIKVGDVFLRFAFLKTPLP